ncbi:MAG: mechanosensitive ion channel family protein [Oscillospiraceae bacterium]|nr:mechanosensitive ion channel family protein [Oscillospiraceae bacterium]
MTFQTILALVLAAAAGVGIAYVKRHYKYTLNQKYILSLVQLVVIVYFLVKLIRLFNPDMDMQSVLLSSSALIVAILGFAAQPVITNIICGMLISFQKPFDVGDRILVEGMSAGVVEDITLRHTVLLSYDGIRMIIPNGELNSKYVTNYSYNMKNKRGYHLTFAVSYDTEVEKAIEVIRDCVAASPYTLSIETDGVFEDSGPVYFMEMGDSSLILHTTIWVTRDTNGNKAVTDVNLRVLNAFRKYGIEIPYPYFNVVEFEGAKPVPEEGAVFVPSASRLRRSETVRMQPGESKVSEAVEVAGRFAETQQMNPTASMQIELLTEESVDLLSKIMGHAKRDFWIEGTAKTYRIHIRAASSLGSVEEYKKMVALSSSGKNAAVNNINQKIMEAMLYGSQRLSGKKKGSKDSFEWKLSDEQIEEADIGKSILAKLANDIRINILPDRVELVVLKTNK